MKAKKVTKKLVLNKVTLFHLNDFQMKDVKGGDKIHPPSEGMSCKFPC